MSPLTAKPLALYRTYYRTQDGKVHARSEPPPRCGHQPHESCPKCRVVDAFARQVRKEEA